MDQDGRRAIVLADIRLDNRVDLLRELHLDDGSVTSDAQILLAAYGRWAENCCDHLRGDFAFAIWDVEEQTLFCARDQMGVKPLFYAMHPDRFLFCSELAGVVASEAGIEDSRMAGFLVGFPADAASTAFRGAHRLPPAHSLTLRNGNLAIRRYWSLAGDPDTRRPAQDVFRELFEDAVASRLRGSNALGAMLSGGLDSSSIVSVAARQLLASPGRTLQTYSFDYPETSHLNEREYVEAVLDTYPVEQTYVGFDDLAPLQGIERLADGRSDLLFAPGLPKMTRLFAAARRNGTRVLLDGHGGDEVVSYGLGRLSELAASGNWLVLHRELRGVADLFGDNPIRMFLRYWAAYGPGRRLHAAARRIWSAPPPIAPSTSFLAPDFAARSDAAEHHAAYRSRLRQAHGTEASLHAWNVSTPLVGEAFEALDRAATLADIELRFPFYDLRLVRFAVAVPSGEILRDGWTRSLLRRAMQDILPPRVQWRRGKIDFSSEVRLGLVRHHRDVLADMSRPDSPIGAYLDIGRLREVIARLIDRPDAVTNAEVFIIWRSAFLSYWLRSRGA